MHNNILGSQSHLTHPRFYPFKHTTGESGPGSVLSLSNVCERYVEQRIRMVGSACGTLAKPVFKNEDLTLEMKIMAYQPLTIPHASLWFSMA